MRTGEAERPPALHPVLVWSVERRDDKLFVTGVDKLTHDATARAGRFSVASLCRRYVVTAAAHRRGNQRGADARGESPSGTRRDLFTAIAARSTWAPRSGRRQHAWACSRARTSAGPVTMHTRSRSFTRARPSSRVASTLLSECALRTALTAYLRNYNMIRVRSGLAYLSPLAFERRAA